MVLIVSRIDPFYDFLYIEAVSLFFWGNFHLLISDLSRLHVYLQLQWYVSQLLDCLTLI